MAERWWVSWAGPDPDGGETIVLVEEAADHRAADRHAHHLADGRGGIATVARPTGLRAIHSGSELVGRVAFIWDGNIVDGWPLHVDPQDYDSPFTGRWEAADDKLSSVREFGGVTHWVEFPEPIWNYERR